MTNPLLNRTEIPDFAAIKNEHYLPALEQALMDIETKVTDIKNNPAAATFENTIVPLDALFEQAGHIMRILSNAALNIYTSEIGDLEEAATLKYADVSKNIYQDAVLGARFRAVYDARNTLTLDADDKAILSNMHLAFERSGALLSADDQQTIRELDSKLISLSSKFRDNLKNGGLQQAVLITDPTELAGLSADQIEGFAETARSKGHAQGWMIIPERLLVDDLLEQAENTTFRHKIFKALNEIGKHAPYDNRPVIADMQKYRNDYAKLLGYDHYASFARNVAMTKDLDGVMTFLDDIVKKAVPKFESDMKALQIFADKNGGPKKLEPWDVLFWANKHRQDLYHFDANEFAQYLEMENVMAGMFNEASHLFGIDLKETSNYPVMHPDIRTYEVREQKNGELVGILHVDMFARPGTKNEGAWMSGVQSKSDGHPNIVILNMNISKPPEGKPALIGLQQYITLYHEMGHCLQGLLGTNVKYQSLQGTDGATDFVEIHSMINERRAVLKENLKKYALHVDTKQPAPDSMIDALIASDAHFKARDTLQMVQNSLRDLTYHSIDPAKGLDDKAVEDLVAIKSDYVGHLKAYPLTRFGHLFSDAHSLYTAGYVNYALADMRAAHGFEAFHADPYNKDMAEKINHFYRRGCGGDAIQLYVDFRGEDATADSMLREIGVLAKKQQTAQQPKPPKP